jgi:hypothetical protein
MSTIQQRNAKKLTVMTNVRAPALPHDTSKRDSSMLASKSPLLRARTHVSRGAGNRGAGELSSFGRFHNIEGLQIRDGSASGTGAKGIFQNDSISTPTLGHGVHNPHQHNT